MKPAAIAAMTIVYLIGGFAGWACQQFGAESPSLFWIIGAVSGIFGTLASQIEG